MRFIRTAFAIAMLLLAFAVPSARGGFELQINGLVDDGKNGHENSKIVTINFKKLGNWVSERVYADPLHATYRDQPFVIYCVDIYHNISLDSHYEVLLKDSSDLGLDHRKIVTALMRGYANDVDSAGERAALQIAIWEAVVDGGADAGADDGNFYVSNLDSSVLNLANSYLHSVGTAGPQDPVTYFDAGDSGGQSMVSIQRAVPEPGTMLLAAMGIVTIGGAAFRESRIRRRRSISPAI